MISVLMNVLCRGHNVIGQTPASKDQRFNDNIKDQFDTDTEDNQRQQTTQLFTTKHGANTGAKLRTDNCTKQQQPGQHYINGLGLNRLQEGHVGGDKNDLKQ